MVASGGRLAAPVLLNGLYVAMDSSGVEVADEAVAGTIGGLSDTVGSAGIALFTASCIKSNYF